MSLERVAYFDLETPADNLRILDIGCYRWDGATFHERSLQSFLDFIKGAAFLCGHNIVLHDLPAIRAALNNNAFGKQNAIDTLFLSPLLFPARPYHHLLKDDKLQVEELNNPVNDARKAKSLLEDQIVAFGKLPHQLKQIFYHLLRNEEGFSAFFHLIHYHDASPGNPRDVLRSYFDGQVCTYVDWDFLLESDPKPLAYALALIDSGDRHSVTPPWVLRQFPDVDRIMHLLRGKPCLQGCSCCDQLWDPVLNLKRFFGFKHFRSYGNRSLQEDAVRAAINGRSLLAVFPTGGGKSITFQLPALMAGESIRGLTVVISPLQSLMKDQVDNLHRKNITEAATINGLLDPIERSKSFEQVLNGNASLLYLSPEALRSNSIERLLLGRKIARFVIDEAHCFSSWGQDFRVDYLYIGDFIRSLQEKKHLDEPIPVSCFTATAKPQVIEDIRTYFKHKLNLDLAVYSAEVGRKNLNYRVYNRKDKAEKYQEVRNLLDHKHCPTIIYVSRTRTANELSENLRKDGYSAGCFHGKLSSEEKVRNQEAFINGEIDIMVATSAFGMGVDKSDVGMVIHFEISDSLENYVQEAGRAGRDEQIQADCFVLFNEDDLSSHFVLLNQTKISIKEINQIWKAIKDLTKTRKRVSNSALEIARKAGWDDNVQEIETRVTTAIAALEDAGYLRRGHNLPQVFATSIIVSNADEARRIIETSELFDELQKQQAVRIIKKLFSSKSKRLATEETAESRIDYISDHLGISKADVLRIIQLLRETEILADSKDLTAFIRSGANQRKAADIVDHFGRLAQFLLSQFKDAQAIYHLKELNENATSGGCPESTPQRIRTLLNFWVIRNWIKRQPVKNASHYMRLQPVGDMEALKKRFERLNSLALSIINYLHQKASEITASPGRSEVSVEFSVLELLERVASENTLFLRNLVQEDIEEALFYLSKTEALKIEGGFLVLYNRLTLHRLEENNLVRYKESDYEKLKDFYENKVHQIHIVGEYAKKMIENYREALQFVDDYFTMNYSSFLNRYFPGSRKEEIRRTITPAKFRQLFADLSAAQLEIIKDNKPGTIVVAAGPGSGKTRVLVHKLASVLLMEDVKHEQFLMLTFSRAAANEFKSRLVNLIGNAAQYIDIKTFHSFCFDLLGRVGRLDDAEKIIPYAVASIRNGSIERRMVTRTMLVIDEAQDMTAQEFELVSALKEANEDLRLILVGDDDQCIYDFRQASPEYMMRFSQTDHSRVYQLLQNFRSRANLVQLANLWAERIPGRLKSHPIVPVSRENGSIEMIRYQTPHLISAVAEAVAQGNFTGSTCLLTRTNDEAVQLRSMLVEKGIHAKLIQSNENFSLDCLEELHAFSKCISESCKGSAIDTEEWNNCWKLLRDRFSDSENLTLTDSVLKSFDKLNPKRKFLTDWRHFLRESRLEDFLDVKEDCIYVSTLHKAKGREFNNVYIMLDRFPAAEPAALRLMYVALTRAKVNLSIHYKGEFLPNLDVDDLKHSENELSYDSSNHMVIQLTHRDVQLGYFNYTQHRMKRLKAGAPLVALQNGLAPENQQQVLKYSVAFQSRLKDFERSGFHPVRAKVGYVIYWYDATREEWIRIILPFLRLEKK